ncbi:hypothetical protein [Candidatus Nitrososphaera gargensis]|uniref:hypothetical protein n=1 Tax=Candidatus Nitrososphaera gargensis TaxID=497727 RepID=UPI0011E538B8|nr:hypothetical protein [Candidatus Nitrososphaera gargensis]
MDGRHNNYSGSIYDWFDEEDTFLDYLSSRYTQDVSKVLPLSGQGTTASQIRGSKRDISMITKTSRYRTTSLDANSVARVQVLETYAGRSCQRTSLLVMTTCVYYYPSFGDLKKKRSRRILRHCFRTRRFYLDMRKYLTEGVSPLN